MRRTLGPAAILALTCSAALVPPASGQQPQPFSFEARGGIGVPVESFGDPEVGWTRDAGSGLSYGMGFSYSLNWYVGAYGGFGQHRFGCPAGACAFDTRLVSTGFDLGGRFVLGTGPVLPWIRVGFLSYRVEAAVPGADEAVRVSSSRAQGFEVGLGFSIPWTQRIRVSPGLRYSRMTPDFPRAGPLLMEYVLADVGLVLGF